MREAQGQSHSVEVDEHIYVYKKLKRRKCHQVLHSLVEPFIKIVSAFIGNISISVNQIISGGFDAKQLVQNLDIEVITDLMKGLPFDTYWTLAQNILDEVEVNGVQLGKLDDHEFYDDKPLHMVKAIWKGIEVNYPFLKDMIRKKGDGSTDSPKENSEPTKK
jgi:hypothetical protein